MKNATVQYFLEASHFIHKLQTFFRIQPKCIERYTRRKYKFFTSHWTWNAILEVESSGIVAHDGVLMRTLMTRNLLIIQVINLQHIATSV